MPLSDEQLYKLILDNQFLTEEQLKKAMEFSTQNKTSLANTILNQGLITDHNLGVIIAEALKLPFIRISKTPIPEDILSIIPEFVAKKQKIIAFGKDNQGLKVGMNNPLNSEIIRLLERKTGEPVRVFYVTERDLNDAFRGYQNTGELLRQKIEQIEKGIYEESQISKTVDLIIEYGYVSRASDIHIEPFEEVSLIRFRVDGVLHDIISLPKKMHDEIITRIKVLSKLRTDEHLSAQDGKLHMRLESEELDIRISILPIIRGEKAVLRLLSSKARQYSLTEIGMNNSDLAKIKNAMTKPFGMILSTGPTGSGKTTSLYAILKILNTRDKNIATIEDPVEYNIEGVNQIQVNAKTNLTFADGLRAILRQDPDIVFVGEIRDKETASIAINAAMTGHLVLSSLHTNNAATSLPRLTDMDIEPFLVASTVNVIIAQRLIRKNCERCRMSVEISKDELVKKVSPLLVKKYFGEAETIRSYQGKGCDICHHTGLAGRIGIFEVLVISTTLRELITSRADASQIQTAAIKEGMTTMLESGLEKVVAGITTIEEVVRATSS